MKVVALSCNPSTEGLRDKDYKFKASLHCTKSSYLKETKLKDTCHFKASYVTITEYTTTD